MSNFLEATTYPDTPYPGYPTFTPSPDTGVGYTPFNTTTPPNGTAPPDSTTCTTDVYAGSFGQPAVICEDDGTTCIGYGNQGTDDFPCYPCAMYTPGVPRYTCFCERSGYTAYDGIDGDCVEDD